MIRHFEGIKVRTPKIECFSSSYDKNWNSNVPIKILQTALKPRPAFISVQVFWFLTACIPKNAGGNVLAHVTSLVTCHVPSPFPGPVMGRGRGVLPSPVAGPVSGPAGGGGEGQILIFRKLLRGRVNRLVMSLVLSSSPVPGPVRRGGGGGSLLQSCRGLPFFMVSHTLRIKMTGHIVLNILRR